MSNRDALLSGARQCVDRFGLSRTTARDVAAAAGVSLAAIGYHFGTTKALMREAVLAGLDEWAGTLPDAVPAEPVTGSRLADVWDRLIDSFGPYRGVLAASYELAVDSSDADLGRAQLAERLERTRQVLAGWLAGVDVAAEPERAHRVGAAHYAIVTGILTQWLADPAAVPRGIELAAAVAEIGRAADPSG